jgi:hypothetical protein
MVPARHKETDMPKFTIDLPESTFIRNIDGKAFNLVWGDVATVLAQIAVTGAKVLLTNVYNGGGKTATDAERFAALQKKIDSWKRGEFNVVERGESQYSSFREVYMTDCIVAGMTSKAAEAALKAKVEEVMGKDTKATFANYIEATAIETAKAGDMTRDEAREALEAYYVAESDRRAKDAAKAELKIKPPVIDLAAFRKASPAKK